MLKVRRLATSEELEPTEERVVVMPTATGKVDAKTGRDIYGPHVTIHITSDEPINLNGHKGLVDLTFTLEEKNARKLVGKTAFLKLKYKED